MRTSTAALVCLGVVIAVPVGPAMAQTVPVEVALTAETPIHSVRIRIPDGTGIGPEQLLDRIATRGRGALPGLRRALRWVPFVPAVHERLLDPFELQRDRERLRRFMARRGYPEAAVDYDLVPTAGGDAVDVVFRILPGPPLLVREVTIAWAGPDAAPGRGRVDADDPDPILADLDIEPPLRVGEALDSAAIEPAAAALERWLGDRGHAFASVETEVEVDTAGDGARVVLRADPGPRARIRQVRVRGSEELGDRALRTFAGVRPGDPYSRKALTEAAARISGLDLVQQSTFRIVPGQPADTLVDVELRVVEEAPREVTGQVGYASDGGIAGEAGWTHRSIFRGAQTLTVTVAGETGVFALEENPEKFVRGTVSLRQPIGSRARLTLDLAPFVGYRNDYRDRSLDYGLEATLLQRLGPSSSVALRYEISTRRVYEYRLGDFSAGVDLLELLQLDAEGVLDSLGARIDRSTISLAGSFGTLDAPTEPRRGFEVAPTVTVTAPPGLNSTQYVSANVRASGYLPVTGSLGLATRFGAGRLFPFGKSVPPSPDEGLAEYFRLRDALFTAGGMDDVRGWADGLLGPKFPRVVFSVEDSTVVANADRYVPIGGFNRIHGSVEARLALPFVGDAWAAHTFVEAGRVWTHDERFTSSEDPNGVEKLFWAAGGGIDYSTPIGTVRVDVGYKLNPSFLDLITAGDFARAIIEGTSFDELPRHPWRRVQIHLGLGTRL